MYKAIERLNKSWRISRYENKNRRRTIEPKMKIDNYTSRIVKADKYQLEPVE